MGSSHDARLRSQQFEIRRPDTGFTNLTRSLYEGDMLGLFDAGALVENLLAHPGWTHVARLVQEAADGLDRKLDGRALDSIQEYAFDHGRRGALLAFPEAARAIVSHAASERSKQARRHEGAAETALEA
jgi:hypothetical protein